MNSLDGEIALLKHQQLILEREIRELCENATVDDLSTIASNDAEADDVEGSDTLVTEQHAELRAAADRAPCAPRSASAGAMRKPFASLTHLGVGSVRPKHIMPSRLSMLRRQIAISSERLRSRKGSSGANGGGGDTTEPRGCGSEEADPDAGTITNAIREVERVRDSGKGEPEQLLSLYDRRMRELEERQREHRKAADDALRNYLASVKGFRDYAAMRQKRQPTTVQPFSFDLREREKPKRIREKRSELEERQREEELNAVLHYKFSATRVPASTFVRKYHLMVEEWCARKEALQILAAERAQKVKNERQYFEDRARTMKAVRDDVLGSRRGRARSAQSRVGEGSRSAPFKAKEVPMGVRVNMWPLIEEQERNRVARIKQRAVQLLVESHCADLVAHPFSGSHVRSRGASPSAATGAENVVVAPLPALGTSAVSMAPLAVGPEITSGLFASPVAALPPGTAAPPPPSTTTAISQPLPATAAVGPIVSALGPIASSPALYPPIPASSTSYVTVAATVSPDAPPPTTICAVPAVSVPVAVPTDATVPAVPSPPQQLQPQQKLLQADPVSNNLIEYLSHAASIEAYLRRNVAAHSDPQAGNPECTFRPSIRDGVPNFELLWAREKLELEERKKHRPPTKPQEFRLSRRRRADDGLSSDGSPSPPHKNNFSMRARVISAEDRIIARRHRENLKRCAGLIQRKPRDRAATPPQPSAPQASAAPPRSSGSIGMVVEAVAAHSGSRVPSGTRAHALRTEAVYRRYLKGSLYDEEAQRAAKEEEQRQLRRKELCARVKQYFPTSAALENKRHIDEKVMQLRQKSKEEDLEAHKRLKEMHQRVSSLPPLFTDATHLNDLAQVRTETEHQILSLLKETGLKEGIVAAVMAGGTGGIPPAEEHLDRAEVAADSPGGQADAKGTGGSAVGLGQSATLVTTRSVTDTSRAASNPTGSIYSLNYQMQDTTASTTAGGAPPTLLNVTLSSPTKAPQAAAVSASSSDYDNDFEDDSSSESSSSSMSSSSSGSSA